MAQMKRRAKNAVLRVASPVAIRTSPQRGPARWRRVNARLRVVMALRLIRHQGDHTRAAALVEPLMGTPAESGAWHVRAVSSQVTGDLTGALESIRTASEKDKRNIDIALLHRQLAAKTGHPDEAKQLISRLAGTPPRNQAEIRKTIDALSDEADSELVDRYEAVLRESGANYKQERLLELAEQLRVAELWRTDRGAYQERLQVIADERERPTYIVARALFGLQEWPELARYLDEDESDSRPLSLGQLKSAAKRAKGKGRTAAAVLLAKQALAQESEDVRMTEIVADGTDQLGVVTAGWPEPPVSSSGEREVDHEAVLSVLAQSLPLTSGGYATRSHGILTGLAARGWKVRAVTKLGFPFDWWRGGIGGRVVNELDVVDGIPYHRLYDPDVTEYPKYPLAEYTQRFADRIVAHATEHQAGLIHASSFYLNGLAGSAAARRLGVPFIYEMRGLEDLMKISRDPSFVETDRHKFLHTVENAVCRDADVVFVITEALRREMSSRGIPDERLIVLPNGVHVDKFAPRERDAELATELGVTGKTVIGYAGGLVDYEGLELLLEAAAALKSRRDDFHVVIVGDGHHEHVLRGMAEELRLGDVLTFTGRVPHAQVGRYISLFDVAPFPRLPLPVCELISPIKPFESMAMGKAVVSSSVAALTEIVDDGKTGLVFKKGSAEDLTAVLGKLIDSPELRADLGRSAREWVLANRDWSNIVTTVAETYQRLLDGAPAPAG